MITKTEVLNKINELLAYSNSQSPQYQSEFTALTQSLIDAVNNYFSITPDGMIEALEDYVFQTYCDIFNRKVVYENPMGELPTDYPEGYNDIRKCFYQFPLLSVTPQQFHGAWVIGTPEGSGEGGAPATPAPQSNAYIDLWTGEITSAPTNDVARVVAVNEWCQTNAGSLNLISLLEDQGKVLESPNTQNVANTIYNEHHLLEVLKTRGYEVYIPTYLRG